MIKVKSTIRTFFCSNSKKLNTLNKNITKYDNYRINGYPNVPLFKIGLVFTGTAISAFGLYIIFKPQIHNYISSEGAHIAGNIVASQELKNSLKVILEDQELLQYAQTIIKKILINAANDSAIKQNINVLLVQLLNDQSTQDALVETAIQFINKQEIKDQLSELIIAILNRQDVKNKINLLVDETCGDYDNREHLKNMINAIFTSKETKYALYDLTTSLLATSIFGKK